MLPPCRKVYKDRVCDSVAKLSALRRVRYRVHTGVQIRVRARMSCVREAAAWGLYFSVLDPYAIPTGCAVRAQADHAQRKTHHNHFVIRKTIAKCRKTKLGNHPHDFVIRIGSADFVIYEMDGGQQYQPLENT